LELREKRSAAIEQADPKCGFSDEQRLAIYGAMALKSVRKTGAPTISLPMTRAERPRLQMANWLVWTAIYRRVLPRDPSNPTHSKS